MAYSNCSNCSGNCGLSCGAGYARRNNNTCCRNSYAALNTVPSCTRYRNYPFYTGNCPDACGCYNCGCTAGVTERNVRNCYGNNRNMNTFNGCSDNCGCSNYCDPCSNIGSCNNNCENSCNFCGDCGCGCDNCNNSCGCSECRNCDCPVYGLFSANIPLTVTAGAALPLLPMAVSTNDFTVVGGTVNINRCGTYMATYTVNIPADAEVDSTLVLNVNGASQPSTLQNISAAGSYTGQTVFTANAGSTVSLISSAALSVTEPVGQNVANLTLVRIG